MRAPMTGLELGGVLPVSSWHPSCPLIAYTRSASKTGRRTSDYQLQVKAYRVLTGWSCVRIEVFRVWLRVRMKQSKRHDGPGSKFASQPQRDVRMVLNRHKPRAGSSVSNGRNSPLGLRCNSYVRWRKSQDFRTLCMLGISQFLACFELLLSTFSNLQPLLLLPTETSPPA